MTGLTTKLRNLLDGARNAVEEVIATDRQVAEQCLLDLRAGIRDETPAWNAANTAAWLALKVTPWYVRWYADRKAMRANEGLWAEVDELADAACYRDCCVAEDNQADADLEELGAWSTDVREWLAHLSTCHPIEFSTDLAAALTAVAIRAGTGRANPERVRAQIDLALANAREETCSGCRPMSAL
ncbi:hypothetical protein ACFV9C_42320 [Kribbella sp. NPDC059898]|uniref:hypothetical protein n=1 Tax=Kribbella sp. NPDC059898 TaxID=3346995 RepID=UPI00364A7432